MSYKILSHGVIHTIFPSNVAKPLFPLKIAPRSETQNGKTETKSGWKEEITSHFHRLPLEADPPHFAGFLPLT